MEGHHPDLQQYLRANGLYCECCARKASARRRLDDGIMKIRNRRTNATESSSSTPVPNDRQEEYFAKLESNGIWEETFKNLTNLSDITSAYFACDMFSFSDHLAKTRMSMLLPQVFGILEQRKYLHYIQPKDDTHGSNKDILALRQVSRAWKAASEEQLLPPCGFSQPNWHRLESTHLHINLKIVTTPFKCTFRNAEDVEMAFKTHGTSRLGASSLSFLRVIDIRVKDFDLSDGKKESFYSNLGKLLDVHGEHVWALHYSFTDRFEYERLANLVACMPHLKELFLNCQRYGHVLSEYEERSLIAQFPFPTIPSLKRLAFSRVGYVLLLSEIIRRNPSVTVLSFVEELGHTSNWDGVGEALENHRLLESWSSAIYGPAGIFSEDDDI